MWESKHVCRCAGSVSSVTCAQDKHAEWAASRLVREGSRWSRAEHSNLKVSAAEPYNQQREQAESMYVVSYTHIIIWAASHSMHTRAHVSTSHAFQIWASWLWSSIRAGLSSSVPACSLCEEQGASMHSRNVFSLCSGAKGCGIHFKGALIGKGKSRHVYNGLLLGLTNTQEYIHRHIRMVTCKPGVYWETLHPIYTGCRLCGLR